MTTLTFTGHATPAQTRTYGYVPFEVPPGTVRIDVDYRYSDQVGSDPHLTDGNTLDLGLIDARGTAFGTMGLRGWSGSNRASIFVAENDATPGYLPGQITPGTWTAHLGFYKIAPQGCDYEVTVTLTSGELAAHPAELEFLPLEGQIARAAPRADGWYRGELHCHTVHSDGDSTVETVIDAARSLSLDFLAITDHNDLSHLAKMLEVQRATQPPLTLIPGCEMTTYFGHWNVWGLTDWVEFRIEKPDDLRRAIAEAKRRGALVSCNHPRHHGPDWEFKDVTDFDLLEVWNGPWIFNNRESLAWWEVLLNQGRRIPIVGGSDMHNLHGMVSGFVRIGTPTTWIFCEDEPTAPNLLAALRAGHSFVSESPMGPRVVLRVDGVLMGDSAQPQATSRTEVETHGAAGSTLVLVGSSGVLYNETIQDDEKRIALTLDLSAEKYVRAEIRADPDIDGLPVMRALSNPVFLTR